MINQWIWGTGYFKQIHVASEKRGTSEATSEAWKSRFEESTWAKKVSRCCKVLPWRSSKDRPVSQWPSDELGYCCAAEGRKSATSSLRWSTWAFEGERLKRWWSDDEAMMKRCSTLFSLLQLIPIISNSPASTCFNSDFSCRCLMKNSAERPLANWGCCSWLDSDLRRSMAQLWESTIPPAPAVYYSQVSPTIIINIH